MDLHEEYETVEDTESNCPEIDEIELPHLIRSNSIDLPGPQSYNALSKLNGGGMTNNEQSRKEGSKKEFAFTTDTYNVYTVFSYVILNYLDSVCTDSMDFTASNKVIDTEFEYDYQKTTQLPVRCLKAYVIDKRLVKVFLNLDANTISFKSNSEIIDLKEKLEHEIKYNNPLRRKHIHIVHENSGIGWFYKKKPTVEFKDIILEPKLLEDIYDNTIFQLEHMDENNGIILYGEPGTGKSMVGQGLIREAISKGYSTCFITEHVNFARLNEVVERLLSPCLMIFEDIDTFGQSRETNHNNQISDFLQFVSGLYTRKEKIVFVATTNHLEHLDKAIKNRPVRFNRKCEFKIPTTELIDRMLKLYFPDCFDNINTKLCHGKDFTGSHIKEIQRTTKLLSKKFEKQYEEVFDDAVEIVSENFVTCISKMGFT